MMTRQRANLGFDTGSNDTEETGFDLSDWEVGTPAPPRPAQGAAQKSAEATGFRSREVTAPVAVVPAPQPVGQGAPVRRRRTGRSAQFNLKARPETIQRFCDVADAQNWGLGETLEYAVALLEREYAQKA
jgi:hypothetical protein